MPEADALLRRQLDILHDAFVPHQVPADLRRASSSSRPASSRRSTTSAARSTAAASTTTRSPRSCAPATTCRTARRAWEASKQIGAEVADQVRELARLRNQAARALGYRDHFALALHRRARRRPPLRDPRRRRPRHRSTVHRRGSASSTRRSPPASGAPSTDLRPWHLDDPFFQDPPADGAVDARPRSSPDADLEALTMRTYDGLGLDLRVRARPQRPATRARQEPARVLHRHRPRGRRARAVQRRAAASAGWRRCSTSSATRSTTASCDRTLPWLVRGAAHALTTEGIAMLFGRLARDPAWLGEVAGRRARHDRRRSRPRSTTAAARRAARVRAVGAGDDHTSSAGSTPTPTPISTRSGGTWWSATSCVRRPDGRHAPDWAAKIHLAAAPVYYQNYLYGELFASQLDATLYGTCRRPRRPHRCRRAARATTSSHRARRCAGTSSSTDATGEPLTPRHLATQLAR